MLRPAILGATPLGGMMAALFANAGLRIALYDRPFNEESPNHHAQSCLLRLLGDYPVPVLPVEALTFIATRNYRDHWQALAQHDLILDCSRDDARSKQALWTRLSPAFNPQAIRVSVSDHLDGHELLSAIPAGHRTRFLVLHPALPLRERRLFELLPTLRTEPRVLKRLHVFFSESLGRKVIELPEGQHSVCARLFLFVLKSAFYRAQNLGLDLSYLDDLTSLLGRSEAGIIHASQQWGWERLQRWQALQHATDWDLPFPEALPRSQRRYPLAEQTQHALLQGHWKKLCEDKDLGAQFLAAHLQDTQHYLQYLQDQGVRREDLETVMRYGLGWSESAFEQLRRFSPTNMNRHPLPSPYPLQLLRGKRLVKTTTSQPFWAEGECVWQRPRSALWLYREQALIWQPREESASLDAVLLQDLLDATQQIQDKHRVFCLYQHGDLGRARSWRHAPPPPEQALLQALLLRLRLLPIPVLAAVSGQVYDYGSALLMQCDRCIYGADTRWHWSTLEEDLPPLGGLWFEWLRQLPFIDEETHQEHVHRTLKRLLSQKSMAILSARSMGLVHLDDDLLSLPEQLPKRTLSLLNQYLEHHAGHRRPRYGLLGLRPQSLQQLKQRAQESPRPALHRAMLTLLALQDDSHSLALSTFLRRESALFNRFLN